MSEKYSKLVQNELKCGQCGDTIFSAHRHDFKYCKCGAVAVDGGMEYVRRVGDFVNAIERSVYLDQDCVDAMRKASGDFTTEQPMECAKAILGVMDEHGYISKMPVHPECLSDMREAVIWGQDNGRNGYGIALAVMRAIRDNGFLNQEDSRE